MNFLYKQNFYKWNKIIKFFRGTLVFSLVFLLAFSPISPVINLPFSDEKIRLGFEVQKAEAAYANGYSYSRSITILETKVTGSSDLTNFPVLISFTEPEFKVGGSGHVTSDNGFDIIFKPDVDGETIDYDNTNNVLYIEYTLAELVYTKTPEAL